jgi:ParB-like chromosome segregation protein Spo0J
MSAQIPFHPLSNMFPLMEGEEFDALVEDIKKNGQREPIVLYQGKILDGRNRYRACLEAGVGLRISKYEDNSPYIGDPAAYVISKNIHRRHLTAEQRQKLIIEVLARAPEKSDRRHAKEIGVDHKTIGAARAKGEDVGRIPHVETRTDTKGRKQPARKIKTAAQRITDRVRRAATRAAARGVQAEEAYKQIEAEEAEVEARAKQLAADLAKAGLAQRVLDCLNRAEDTELADALSALLRTGNDDDPDASAEAMKAKFAEADAAAVDDPTDPGPSKSLRRGAP